eukprot:969869_1
MSVLSNVDAKKLISIMIDFWQTNDDVYDPDNSNPIKIHDKSSEAKALCKHVFQFSCVSETNLFCVKTLESLCYFTATELVYECVSQRHKEHLKCTFLTKCYQLEYPDDFELHLKHMTIFKSNYLEFQVISEALKCIRNCVHNSSKYYTEYQECSLSEQKVVEMFVKCISSSYSDGGVQQLMMELAEPRQLAEHFTNSVAAVAFVSGTVHIAPQSHILTQLLISILKMCNTFWGDRKLSIEQTRQISMDITKLSAILSDCNDCVGCSV